MASIYRLSGFSTLLSILLLLCMLVVSCITQFVGFVRSEERTQLTICNPLFEKPPLQMDAFEFALPGSLESNLQIYCEISQSLLKFTRNDSDGIHADYVLSLEVRRDGSERPRISSTTWQERITLAEFPNRREASKTICHNASFNLPPGDYTLQLNLKDQATGRTFTHRAQRRVKGSSPRSTITMSEIMVVNEEVGDSDTRLPLPNLTRIFDNPNLPFSAFFEIHSNGPDSVEIEFAIFNEEGQPHCRERFKRAPGIIREGMSLCERIRGTGRYFLRVNATSNLERAAQQQSFTMRYRQELPDSVLARATWQALRHIATGEEFRKIRESGEGERSELIADFWQTRTPSPSAPDLTELRREFERRVEFSMRYFGLDKDGTPGWASDRGRIYILYGPPQDIKPRDMIVERSPYQFWRYPAILKQFVFLDRKGDGRFKLVHED